jgi:hypothetical protein
MNAKPASLGQRLGKPVYLLTFLALVVTAGQAAVIFLPICDIYHLRLSLRSW